MTSPLQDGRANPVGVRCSLPQAIILTLSLVVVLSGAEPMLADADAGTGTGASSARNWVVCPDERKTGPVEGDNREAIECTQRGYAGLQQTVDLAVNGDTITLRPGLYSPTAIRDVPHGDLIIRGAVLIEGKTLQLSGEPGAILDGSMGVPACALVIKNGRVNIDGLEIRNFRAELEEDKIYDGHGVFSIDSDIQLNEVNFRYIAKMAITLFGSSTATLTRIQVLDSHIGIWTNDQAQLTASNGIFSNNDSAAVAAYGHSSSRIINSIIEQNQDDGVYAEESAVIDLRNSILVGNRPYAVRAVDQATIGLDYNILHANEAAYSGGENRELLTLGTHLYHSDPGLDMEHRAQSGATIDKGDPAVLDRDGSVSDIGLFGGPDAPTQK